MISAEPVSHSSAHYLMALSELLKERGYARAVDVAERLEVSRTAAHAGLKALKSKGLIREDKRHFYTLADKSQELVSQLRVNHTIAELLFKKVLDLEKEEAHENACRIEHLLSPAASRRLTAFLKFLDRNEAGDELLREFRRARSLCPKGGQCELCEVLESCPLGDVESMLDAPAGHKRKAARRSAI